MYFKARDLSGIAVCAALWGILNWLYSPIFFQLFGLPFLCDIVGFASIILAVWWVGKPGASTLTGIIATIINFITRPTAIHFLGFTAASIVFDAIMLGLGYNRIYRNRIVRMCGFFLNSVISAAIAGLIIGFLFMDPKALLKWGGAYGWAGLHAIGGAMGGIIGIVIVEALITRGVKRIE